MIEGGKAYRAAIYNRCSSAEQADALAVQVQQSREIVREKGWQLIEQYQELQSGTGTEKRKEYRRMLADMQADRFDILVVKSLDRLMRSAKEWYIFLDLLLKHKKELFLYMENRFYDTQNGALLAGIQALINDDFSKNLSNKLKERHRIRQKNRTGFNFSRPIYGWDKRTQSEYVINEEQAYYYRECFRLLREGHGFYTIANMLYTMGARNSLGRKIEAAEWRNLCRSPRAYGCVILNKETMNFHTKKREPVPESEWVIIEDALPPIVSKQEWEDAQAIMESRKTQDHRTCSGKYKLSHKIVCGLCGAAYHRMKYQNRNGSVQPYWKCASAYRNGRDPVSPDLRCTSENISEQKLLKLIVNACEAAFGDLYETTDVIAERCLGMIRRMLEKRSSQQILEKLQRELDKQNQKKDVLYEKLMSGLIDDESFKIYSDRLSREMGILTQRIGMLEADEKAHSHNEERLQEMQEVLKTSGIIERCRAELYLTMIEKIVVNGDGTITLQFDRGRCAMLGEDLRKCEMTVLYDGQYHLKRKVARQKEQLLELIGEHPFWSYANYAEALQCSKNEVASRIRYLVREGRIQRNKDGGLAVIG